MTESRVTGLANSEMAYSSKLVFMARPRVSARSIISVLPTVRAASAHGIENEYCFPVT